VTNATEKCTNLGCYEEFVIERNWTTLTPNTSILNLKCPHCNVIMTKYFKEYSVRFDEEENVLCISMKFHTVFVEEDEKI